MDASEGSAFIDATIPSGSARPALRSRMTSVGVAFRISVSAASRERAKATSTPSRLAAVRILDVNIKSSTIARITGSIMILEMRAAPPFHKNGFVLGCETTREAVLIDPGDEVAELLTAAA